MRSRPGTRRGGVLALAGAIAMGALVAPLRGQSAVAEISAAPTPYLAADHWVILPLRRLEGLGLLPLGFDPGSASYPVGEVVIALDHAVASATGPVQELVRQWQARLQSEFRGLEDQPGRATSPIRHLGGYARSGYRLEVGQVAGGLGFFPEAWSGPRPMADTRRMEAAIRWSAVVHGAVVVDLAPRYFEETAALDRWSVSGVVGPIGGWIGRRSLAFGSAQGGSVVLSDYTGPAAGLHTARPLALPGFLAALGPVRFETSLGRIGPNGTVGNPWFWTARARIQPHPRLAMAVNRAAMFAGDQNTSISLRNLAYLLIGKHAGEEGEFDNQVVAVEVRYRPPLEEVLPLVLLLEWGFEDSAGGWRDVPGILLAVHAPSLPIWPEAGGGVELTYFAPFCCSNSPWYRNWAFLGGWTDDGRPLGHPLAGHGVEARAFGTLGLMSGAVQLQTDVFLRDRGLYNLYAPQRMGISFGGGAEVDGRVADRAGLILALEYERGRYGWSGYRVSMGAEWIF